MDKILKEYGNMFSSSLYFYKGYYFARLDGQGSVIHITKQTNKK